VALQLAHVSLCDSVLLFEHGLTECLFVAVRVCDCVSVFRFRFLVRPAMVADLSTVCTFSFCVLAVCTLRCYVYHCVCQYIV